MKTAIKEECDGTCCHAGRVETYDYDTKCFEYTDCECEECHNDDDAWEACYEAKTVKMREFTMACGSTFWYNYIVEFDDEGEQICVYVENKDGKHLQPAMRLAYRIKNGDEQLKLVGLKWEPRYLQEEGLVNYCE